MLSNGIRFGIVLWLITSVESFAFSERISIFTGPAGGHPGVTESLVKGLQKLNIPYDQNNYTNPSSIVVVLADTVDLKRAIALKQHHRIKVLIAGPNLVVRSNDLNGLIGSPEIDAYMVPSEWTKIAYEEDLPTLEGRMRLWCAGIDEQYWKPVLGVEKNKVLVYWKTESEPFCEHVESILKTKGFTPLRVRYGKYTKEQFKSYLNQSMFAVFISRSESQGLALAEAWAMDVPTLAFEPGELMLQGKQYSSVSGCPLLTDFTGQRWKDVKEFEELLNHYTKYAQEFAPRSWVVKNLTYVASATSLIDIVKGFVRN